MRAVFAVFLATQLLVACAWKHIEIEGAVPRSEVPRVIERFDAFGKFLEEEQKRGRKVPLTVASGNPWQFDFVLNVPRLYENFVSDKEEDQRVYSGRYLEGYAAFREWWPNFDTPQTMQIGGHAITIGDYEHLRYYEVDFTYVVKYGHPLHEEIVIPIEHTIEITDRLKLIALVDGENVYALDARRMHMTDSVKKSKHEAFFGRFGRYFVDIINAVLGNGPANMAPTPMVR